MMGSHSIVSSAKRSIHTALYPLQGGWITQYCIFYKEGFHTVLYHLQGGEVKTVLYHLQGGGIMQNCIINKEEGSTVLYHLQGGGVTQYCIISEEEWSLCTVSSTRIIQYC